jgi:hypothetical protein
MQIRVRNQCDQNGFAVVEVIDPSDGAVTHSAPLSADQQIVVTATSAHSPADIEFGEVEAILSEEPEQAATAGGEEEGEAVAGGAEEGHAVADGDPQTPLSDTEADLHSEESGRLPGETKED